MEQLSPHKWYVLALASASVIIACSLPYMCMPVFFKQIIDEMGLNLSQVGLIWGITSFSAFFTLIIGGSLVDRFGARVSMFFLCIVAGIFGASRGFAVDFISLLATSFLFGTVTTIVPLAAFKAVTTWFPARQVGLANSIITASVAVGFAITSIISATVLSPILNGWRNVLFLYGFLSLIIGILWVVVIKKPASRIKLGSENTGSLAKTVLYLLKNRQILLLGLSMLGFMGAIQGVGGYLPLYLRNMGWEPATADGALALMQVAGIVASIPLLLLSDHLGSRKGVIIPLFILLIFGVLLCAFFSNALIWLLVIFIGSSREGYMGLSTTMNVEMESVGPFYTGAAIGVVQTISRIGVFIAPPLGNSFAVIDPGLPFVIWTAFGVIGLASVWFIKETRKHPR